MAAMTSTKPPAVYAAHGESTTSNSSAFDDDPTQIQHHHPELHVDVICPTPSQGGSEESPFSWWTPHHYHHHVGHVGHSHSMHADDDTGECTDGHGHPAKCALPGSRPSGTAAPDVAHDTSPPSSEYSFPEEPSVRRSAWTYGLPVIDEHHAEASTPPLPLPASISTSTVESAQSSPVSTSPSTPTLAKTVLSHTGTQPVAGKTGSHGDADTGTCPTEDGFAALVLPIRV
ncbi:hypothetical protein C8Q77DRAFT_1076121 [Trametes polyzona]|nr:hypothetical protein C8Q77DRAFT_1076121 [Trametes polyzona]